MKQIEPGDTRVWTWNSTSDPDALEFCIFNNSGTMVASGTAVKSGTGQWYSVLTVPGTAGYYNTRWTAWASSLPYYTEELVHIRDISAVDVPSSYYATIPQVRDRLLVINAAGNKINNSEISDVLVDVMARMDAKLARAYTLPFSSTPRLVRTLCKDFAVFEIARRFIPRGDGDNLQSWLLDMQTRAVESLDALAVGSMMLITDSGTAWPTILADDQDASAIKHIRHDGVRPTFTELDQSLQRQDPDYLDEIADEIYDD